MFDLKLFRKYNKLTQSDLGEILDVAQATIARAEKGELVIPPRWLEVLTEKYGLVIDNFISPDNIREPIIKYRDNGNKADPNKQTQIPLYALSVEAGFGTGLENSPDYIEGYIQMPGIGKNDGSWVVSGHSMYPTISKGSRVVLRKIEDWNLIEWNNIYVVDIKEMGAKVKRIKKGKQKDLFLLISDNNEYEPMDIAKKDILNIYRVLIAFEIFLTLKI